MTTLSKEELLRIEANKDATENPRRVTVLYGDYGNGKTVTACSMTNERGLLLTSDDSWTSLLNKKHADLYAKHKITPLEGLSQFDHIDFNGYDTIIWDTVSQSTDVFLDLLYDEADWGGKYRDKLSTKNPTLKAMNIETLAPVDYRVTRDTIRPIINKLLHETEANIIFTSQMVEPIPGLSSNPQKRPAIPAATFKIIGTRADIIGHVQNINNKFTVDVTQNMTQLGKTRIEGIQGRMDSVSFVTKYKEIVFK